MLPPRLPACAQMSSLAEAWLLLLFITTLLCWLLMPRENEERNLHVKTKNQPQLPHAGWTPGSGQAACVRGAALGSLVPARAARACHEQTLRAGEAPAARRALLWPAGTGCVPWHALWLSAG